MRLVLVGLAALASVSCERTTQGDLRDREAAAEVSRCAEQYLGRPNSGSPQEVWMTCLKTVSETSGRDQDKIAAHVSRAEGRVFGQ